MPLTVEIKRTCDLAHEERTRLCALFESVFLKQMCEKHGGPPSGSGAAKALESAVNLLSVIFGQIYFPTYSNGLKEIAGWLGFR